MPYAFLLFQNQLIASFKLAQLKNNTRSYTRIILYWIVVATVILVRSEYFVLKIIEGNKIQATEIMALSKVVQEDLTIYENIRKIIRQNRNDK